MPPAHGGSRSWRPSRGAASPGRKRPRSQRTTHATASKFCLRPRSLRPTARSPPNTAIRRRPSLPKRRRDARAKLIRTSLEERNQQANSALTFARDKGFEREAVLDERAIFVEAMRRGMGEMTYPEVRANFEARIASGEFREVAEQTLAGRHFTTARTIQAEKEIIRSVREGQGRAPQLMSIQDAIPLTESHQQLNQTQRKAHRANPYIPRSNPGTYKGARSGKDQHVAGDTSGRRAEWLRCRGIRADLPRRPPTPRSRHHRRHLARIPRACSQHE